MVDVPDRIDVLHVDDDPQLCDLTATFLERIDDRLRVRTETSPEEGLDVLSSADVDCVVSDYEMPGMDGIEFLEAVRERYPAIPFVLYTGKGSEEVASEAISTGATDYLRKQRGSENYELLANRIVNAVEKTRSMGRANRYKRIAELVRTIQSALVRATTREEIDAAVCETLAEAEPYQRVRIVELDAEGDRVRRAVAGHGADVHVTDDADHASDDVDATEDAAERDLIESATSTGSVTVAQIGRASDHESIRGGEGADRDGRSVAVVPLVYDETNYGAIVCDAERTDAFGQDERDLLAELGETVAHALERAALQRQYEEQYRELFENAPVMFAFTRVDDGDLVIEECNDQFASRLGYSTEELRDRPVADLYTDDSRWQLREGGGYERALAGEFVAEERQLVTKDGERVSTVLRASPRRNEDGDIVGTNSLYVDLTHRERIEAVSQRRRQLRQILDLIPDFVFVKDADGEFFLANEAMADAFDTTPEAMVGKTDFDLVEDELARQFQADDREVIETNSPKYVPREALTDADGETHVLETRKIPFTIAGTDTDAVLSYARDVTDLRERERTIRRMYRLVSDPDSEFEEKVDGLLEIGMDALELDYGIFATADETDYTVSVARSPEDRIDGGDTVPRSTTVCDHVMRTGESLITGNLPVDAPEVAERASEPVEGVSAYVGAPVSVEDADAGVVCFFDTEARSEGFSEWEATLVDLVGQWLSYESGRERLTDDLARQNERLEEFATIVSHDLRNPLNVAEGRLELAREECDSDHLADVGRAHDRMADIIDSVLSLAREGESATDVGPVELDDVAQACWDNVETRAATLDVAADRTILADANRLRRLFENLFRNAVEHGGDDVQVRVGTSEDGFYVADDGQGIPEDEREAVFETGYSSQAENGGLGLSIVEEIARSHDWTVDVRSGRDGGVRFEFTGVERP